MMGADKAAFRKRLKEKRGSLDRREFLSHSISNRLLLNKQFLNAENIFIYISAGSEVQVWGILDYCFKSGKNLFAPRCHEDKKRNDMSFYKISSLEDLSTGSYGISEPKAYCKEMCEADTLSCICIVPGLSFDEKGTRLGYGKGYYDKFLKANSKIYSIGLCYEEMLETELPKDAHDMAVDEIITESRSIRISAGKEICNE